MKRAKEGKKEMNWELKRRKPPYRESNKGRRKSNTIREEQ